MQIIHCSQNVNQNTNKKNVNYWVYLIPLIPPLPAALQGISCLGYHGIYNGPPRSVFLKLPSLYTRHNTMTCR